MSMAPWQDESVNVAELEPSAEQHFGMTRWLTRASGRFGKQVRYASSKREAGWCWVCMCIELSVSPHFSADISAPALAGMEQAFSQRTGPGV
jgi:hypothetical protein